MGIFDMFKNQNKKEIIFDNDSLKEAVKDWINDSSISRKKYGHISTWDVSQVTNMEYLFSDA